jgi:hypothetical protein
VFGARLLCALTIRRRLGCQTGAVTRMNWQNRRGGDDDFGAVGAEPTMPAKYPGTCATCGERFAAGDPITSVLVDKKWQRDHGHCRYPATALLQREISEADVDATARSLKAPTPGKCRAVTGKGKPCNNAPQRGEVFCGPHLTQLVTGPAVQPSSNKPDPYDEPF